MANKFQQGNKAYIVDNEADYTQTKKKLNNQSLFLLVQNQVIGNTISITKLPLKNLRLI